MIPIDTNTGILLKECKQGITVLNLNRINSDIRRHELYTKRDNGEQLTEQEDEEIQIRCEYEDLLKEAMNKMNGLIAIFEN